MAANLYRRGETWWWKAMIGGVQYRKTTGMKDLQMAKRKASEFDKEIRAGNAGWGERVPTMGEWVARYLSGIFGTKLARDKVLLRWIHDEWRDLRLDSIKRSDCQRYVDKRVHEAKNAPGTIWLECGRIKHLFNLAIEDGIIAKNPWGAGRRGIRLPTPPARNRVLSREEEAKIRAVIDEGWLSRLFTVVLGTGLRRREVLGLRPCDIVDGVVKVPKALAKGGKARSVPLRREVREALRAQVPFEHLNAATGLWEAVAGTEKQRFFPRSQHYVTVKVRQAAEKAGIEGLTLHDLRRTFATRCATGELTGTSIPLLHLTRIMGHSNPRITAHYYVYLNDAELIKQMKDQVAEPVDDATLKPDMLEGQPPKPEPTLHAAPADTDEYPSKSE